MALGQRRQIKGDLDVEIDMVPIMNMFLILIPFLLASSSFLNIKAINTSVPVNAESSIEMPRDLKNQNKQIKITAIVKVALSGIEISTSSDELSQKELQALDARLVKSNKNEKEMLRQLSKKLDVIKKKYPLSDTLILIPENAVTYESIVAVMDAARHIGQKQLFPIVVVSGEID